MEDECGLLHFLAIDEVERHLIYPDTPLFGFQVEDKLPSAVEDISEAGKCIGFNRATAGVFHLMRVMEIGVQKLGEKLDIEFSNEKMWLNILDQVNAKIKAMGKQGQAYAAVAAHLYNVKLAWRNEVMHPKATYTLEEAKSIFVAVKNYMDELVKVIQVL
jgi:hypothetical protein